MMSMNGIDWHASVSNFGDKWGSLLTNLRTVCGVQPHPPFIHAICFEGASRKLTVDPTYAQYFCFFSQHATDGRRSD
jgi:hypothetical protein